MTYISTDSLTFTSLQTCFPNSEVNQKSRGATVPCFLCLYNNNNKAAVFEYMYYVHRILWYAVVIILVPSPFSSLVPLSVRLEPNLPLFLPILLSGNA